MQARVSLIEGAENPVVEITTRLAKLHAGKDAAVEVLVGRLAPLWARLAERIASEKGAAPVVPVPSEWREPAWEEVAPGISCKLLATDAEAHRVSMLVRLAPGAHYPPHTHAGVEELHLLDGELWIDERKLFPGDYNYGAPGARDDRVWSESGCTCLLDTCTKDLLL